MNNILFLIWEYPGTSLCVSIAVVLLVAALIEAFCGYKREDLL